MKRILWLSDIHLNGVNTKSNTIDLIQSFNAYVQNIISIDYLVISGDLATAGGEKNHYKAFFSLIIEPIKARFKDIKIISVPGNHDVDWAQVNREFYSFMIEGKDAKSFVLKSFKKDVGESYYRNVFSHYKEFHKDHIKTIQSETFSNYYVEGNIVFISLNSAWLSVGVPLSDAEGKLEGKFRVIQGIKSYEFYKGDSEKPFFTEIGNQSYGFTLGSEIKGELSKMQMEIEENYKDHFKVVVCHHPPNNWMAWDELYSEEVNTKSDFHKFITKLNVDLMLVGHEHTSIVEGGLLFGKTLVLYGGMFLDHHQENYSNSWFKILEIETKKSSLIEKSFLFQPKNDTWKEIGDSEVSYTNWKNVAVVQSINDTIHNKRSSVSNSHKKVIDLDFADDSQLHAKVEKIENIQDEILTLLNLANFPQTTDALDIGGGVLKFLTKIKNEQCALYVVNNIDDIFTVKSKKSIKNSYLQTILNDKHSELNVFIFYNYSISNEIDKTYYKFIKRIIRKKFEHFRFLIFQDKTLINKLKNAKFAIRMVK